MLSLWRDADAGVEVVRLIETAEIEEVVCLFEDVAQAEGWQPAGALRRWRDRSVYFGVQVEGQLAGGLQLVRPDARGTLPCQEVWPEVLLLAEVSPTRCAHAAMLAVDAAYRGRSILFWHLAIEMWRHCVGAGITTLFIEVTPRVLPIYRRLGWPLQIRGELRRHWGEDCYLCTLGIPEVAQALLQRAEHSPYYWEIIAQAFRVTLNSWEEPIAKVSRC